MTTHVQFDILNRFCAVNFALAVFVELDDMVRMSVERKGLKRDCIGSTQVISFALLLKTRL